MNFSIDANYELQIAVLYLIKVRIKRDFIGCPLDSEGIKVINDRVNFMLEGIRKAIYPFSISDIRLNKSLDYLELEYV